MGAKLGILSCLRDLLGVAYGITRLCTITGIGFQKYNYQTQQLVPVTKKTTTKVDVALDPISELMPTENFPIAKTTTTKVDIALEPILPTEYFSFLF
jgi:hypothetical protein